MAEVETAPKVLNVYQRLVKVRQSLGGIAKSGTAPAVMGGYSFVTWEDVAAKVGGLFAEHGIVPVTSMADKSIEQVGSTKNGAPIYRAVVTLSLSLYCADDPEAAPVSVLWAGVGDDSGDKSVQKAATSATKYCLMKLLMLGGADDSDANGEDSKVATPATRGNGNGNGAGRPVQSAPPQRQQSAGECLLCAEQGLTAKSGAPSRFYANRRDGSFQCNGVSGERADGSVNYVNHPKPVTDAERVAVATNGDIDPDSIPF